MVMHGQIHTLTFRVRSEQILSWNKQFEFKTVDSFISTGACAGHPQGPSVGVSMHQQHA